ncbi:unnamed protein product [Gongylonema pulchrum]|uniref:Uncharacterized protein n=1 Tax=Gongylonema pulchrum TaxID=637853 RepID=A0A3P7RFQ9_9BILA|nr:unnamed protein product [Gongylonema pulchrum]
MSLFIYVFLGLNDLLRSTEIVCKAQLRNLDLKTPVDEESLRQILFGIKRRMDLLDCRHFSYLIVPKFANKNGYAVRDVGQLNVLLTRLVDMLESSKFCESARQRAGDGVCSSAASDHGQLSQSIQKWFRFTDPEHIVLN